MTFGYKLTRFESDMITQRFNRNHLLYKGIQQKYISYGEYVAQKDAR